MIKKIQFFFQVLVATFGYIWDIVRLYMKNHLQISNVSLGCG